MLNEYDGSRRTIDNEGNEEFETGRVTEGTAENDEKDVTVDEGDEEGIEDSGEDEEV